MKPDFDKCPDGLVPVIVQDSITKEVLMLAYMNESAWEMTLSTKYAVYWSRSRKKLWKKGESSGNLQKVMDIFLDCDDDTILLKVEQVGGAACHTGHKSCFYTKIQDDGSPVIVGKPIFDPDEIYKNN